MNTLQHSDLKVNAGKPKPSETPLWKGKTTFKVNGKALVAAVSVDRTWFRVRFEGWDEPLPPELHAQMTNASFWWAKKENNLAYFGESNEAKVRMLRELGFSGAKHITEPVIREVVKVKGNVEHPAHVEAKGKKTTTVAGTVVSINSVGKPFNVSNGQFIAKDKLMSTSNGKHINGYPVHEDGESQGHDLSREEADAYDMGFEYGKLTVEQDNDLKYHLLRGYEDGMAVALEAKAEAEAAAKAAAPAPSTGVSTADIAAIVAAVIAQLGK